MRFTRCVVAGNELELPSAGALALPALAIGAADSRLAFEYVAVDPVDGPRLRYQTRLEGLDAGWSTPTRELSARYGQLAPGSYRFTVRALDPKSGAEGPPTSVALVVLPPLWARGWFLALALLAAGALAWGAHRLRLRRALALERVRTAIASDLHDDLGAGLAQIAISSERARRAGGPEASLLMGEVAGPDVLLADIGLPGMSGIEGLRRYRARHAQALVLMLSVFDDDQHVFEAICAGASGYLLKDTPPERLREAIRELVAGGASMTPEIARRVVATFRQVPQTTVEHGLSPRELDVLRALGQGHSYKTAARALDLSIDTVRFHIRNIYTKLHVHSKSEAVLAALKRGIV